MPVPYSPLAVANYFLGDSPGLEHMKLQKLVYCAHGWWLAGHADAAPALVNERPEVWRHGPVFSSLYRVLKIFGREPIQSPQSLSPFDAPPMIDADDAEVRQLLNWVWARYGHLSSFALSELTHRSGTPWSRVAKEHSYRVPLNLEIPDEYIRDEFRSLMAREAVQPGGRVADDGREREHIRS